MKKLMLLLIFSLILSAASAADIIADYSIPSTVSLDDYLAVSGTFIDDLNNSANAQCDVYFEKDGIEIYRFTSQNTDLRGHFFFRSKIPSNAFKIDEDYNVLAVCGTGTATQQITVTQRKTPYNELAGWWLWLTNPETIFLPILIIIVFAIAAATIYFIYRALRQRRVNY